MKLTKLEKKEMIVDGRNKNRMATFRKVKNYRFISFEKYISWLEIMQSINPVKSHTTENRIINYKQVKI